MSNNPPPGIFDLRQYKVEEGDRPSPLSECHTSHRILMGPGPSDVHYRVLQAMSTPLVGHLDPEFLDIMDDIKQMVQACFQTQNELTFVVSAPGSAGMETCLVNLLEPGDEALICSHGVFGGRLIDIAERCGAKVTKVEAPWGEHIDPAQVKEALTRCKPKIIAIVHAETSTGVLQPMRKKKLSRRGSWAKVVGVLPA